MRKLLDGARSVISAALCYYEASPERPEGTGRLPRYTWNDRYAELREKLDDPRLRQLRRRALHRRRQLHRWLRREVQLLRRHDGPKLRLANRRCIPPPGIMFISIRRAVLMSIRSCPPIAFFIKRAASVMPLQLRLYT